jgi:hypothetical protein
MVPSEFDTDQVVLFINEDKLTKCPEISIRTKSGINLKAIIDTGSEVNLILEKAFKLLNNTEQNVLILPVENVKLITAFGKRSKKIKSQTLLEFILQDDEFEGVFMISSQLNNDAIIGCQLLKEYGIDIHFGKGTIGYTRDCNYKLIRFEQEQLTGFDINFRQMKSQRKLWPRTNLNEISHATFKEY